MKVQLFCLLIFALLYVSCFECFHTKVDNILFLFNFFKASQAEDLCRCGYGRAHSPEQHMYGPEINTDEPEHHSSDHPDFPDDGDIYP